MYNPGGQVIGATTAVGGTSALLANTGAPAWLSIAIGVVIFSTIAVFYAVSKIRNKAQK